MTNYDQVLANVLAMNGGTLPAGVQPPQAVAQQLQDAGSPPPGDGVTDTTALLPSSPGTADQVQPQTAPESGVPAPVAVPAASPPIPGGVGDAGVPVAPVDVTPLPPVAAQQPAAMGLTPQAAVAPQVAPLPVAHALAAASAVVPRGTGGGGGPAVPSNITPQSAANDIANERTEAIGNADQALANEGIKGQVEAQTLPAQLAANSNEMNARAQATRLSMQDSDRMVAAVEHFNQDHYQPDHFMQTRTTGQKWEIAASMILGAIGAGATGVNAGVQAFNENRNRDLEMQKLQFEHDKDAVGAYADLAKTLQQNGLTASQSGAAARVAMIDQQNAMLRTRVFSRYGAKGLDVLDKNPGMQAVYASQAKAKADLSKNMFENRFAEQQAHEAGAGAGLKSAQAAQTRFTTAQEKAVFEKYGIQPPVGMLSRSTNEGMTRTPEEAKAVTDADAAYDEMQGAMNNYKTKLETGGLGGQDQEGASAVAAAAVAKYLGIARAAGAPEDTINRMTEVASPGWWNNVVRSGRAKNQLMAAGLGLKAMHNGMLAGHGLQPRPEPKPR